eukprot:jgi/Chlat1/5522/Chrsp369S00409
MAEEAAVGITCYANSLPGFRAVLKQRYADFVVNEVDRDGNVVHLTSIDAPGKSKQPAALSSDANSSSTTLEAIDTEAVLKDFAAVAGDDNAERLRKLLKELAEIIDVSAEASVSAVLAASDDKAQRTAVHEFVKQRLPFLSTDTVDPPGERSSQKAKCVCLRPLSQDPRARQRNANKRKREDDRGSRWPRGRGDFLRFVLYKENKETQDAVGVLGRMLHVHPKAFGMAGTKDKRACTSQLVTAYRLCAEQLAPLNARLIAMGVGNFEYCKEPLQLGDLWGNRFTITLRGVVADDETTVAKAAAGLQQSGFINYFGLQRFGSGNIPTHAIGIHLMKGEWEDAVRLIMQPREGEREQGVKAREHWVSTKDPAQTLNMLPLYATAERAVMQGLRQRPNDYKQALLGLPRTLRMMYIHSYQSYLWNSAVSYRVQQYGAEKVITGDLVAVDAVNDAAASTAASYELASYERRSKVRVKVVTPEEADSGAYSVDALVLPMPGYLVRYPANNTAEIYHQLAAKDGISLTNTCHNVSEFSLVAFSGDYRRVINRPKDMSWSIIKYSNPKKPLVETDLVRLQAKSQATAVSTNGEQTTSGNTNGNPSQPDAVNDTEQQGVHTALQLSVTLPASSYATMLVRELLKTSTAVAFHRLLNDPQEQLPAVPMEDVTEDVEAAVGADELDAVADVIAAEHADLFANATVNGAGG